MNEIRNKKKDKEIEKLEERLKKQIMDVIGFYEKEASRFARVAAVAHRDFAGWQGKYIKAAASETHTGKPGFKYEASYG